MPEMIPEDYVAALYRGILQREPDPAGLAAFSRLVRETNDPTLVVAHMLSSEEYRSKKEPPPTAEVRVADCIAALGGMEITIVDVGAQTLSTEAHVYQPLLRPDIPHHVIGFEPLADKVAQRRSVESASALTLLPYAIGDGRAHILHVNNEDATSSLYPLNGSLVAKFEHLHTLFGVRQEPVTTKKLDDVLPDRPIHFLKLDIQGAEMLALYGAGRTLARTAVVHCEVEFAPIYEGQALFSEVQSHLVQRGFSLIDLLISHRYAYRTHAGVAGCDRLLWGDAVFFRDEGDAPTLASQALIATLIYRKLSLAEHLCERLTLRQGAPLP